MYSKMHGVISAMHSAIYSAVYSAMHSAFFCVISVAAATNRKSRDMKCIEAHPRIGGGYTLPTNRLIQEGRGSSHTTKTEPMCKLYSRCRVPSAAGPDESSGKQHPIPVHVQYMSYVVRYKCGVW
jgi:hypothetical protein